ncbi:MAG: hypothetical protein QUU85_17790 [Candidatus Eisenbacteria bacterium]|nr:hypothetical protein [Candidatus Eisenbacteria bacterium]
MNRTRISRLFLLGLAAVALAAAASCSLAPRPAPPILLGQQWESARPRLDAWRAAATGGVSRAYDAQQIASAEVREFPPLDSLLLADVYRRAGVRDSRFLRFPPAPAEHGRLCRESYILSLIHI